MRFKTIKRRVISISIWFLCSTVLLATAPVWILLVGLYDIILRRDFNTLRTISCFTLLFVSESIGLIWAFLLWLRKPFFKDPFKWHTANRRIQRWYARTLVKTSIWIYNITYTIEGQEALDDDNNALLLPRHASVIDTMFPLWMPTVMKNYRYVLKAELLQFPGLDIIGHRFPNIYVHRDGKNTEGEIARILTLLDNMPGAGGVVIFPEGTRYTPEKRARLLEKFKDTNEKFYAITQALKSTLSPLRGGGLALLNALPNDVDVIFISHYGLDKANTMASLLAGGFTNAHLKLKIWRVLAKDIPKTTAEIERFLFEQWLKVDAWAQGKPIEEAMTIEEAEARYPAIAQGWATTTS